MNEKLYGSLMGLSIGDALGVPAEFESREALEADPITDMKGHGTYDQPPGTWSDDTGLTLCLMDSLCGGGLDYSDIMSKFRSWLENGEYTPHGEVFDVGHATKKAILLSVSDISPQECGNTHERANGNGSLIRILPMAFYLYPLDLAGDLSHPMEQVHNVSALTHAHQISKISCGIYVLAINAILAGKPVDASLAKAKEFYEQREEFREHLHHFSRLFNIETFKTLPASEIKSTTYVVDTLEAAFWCLLTTDNYEECVLKAVNLGIDTDSVAAVAGGLAGAAYGFGQIPERWIDALARKDFLLEMCGKFEQAMKSD